MNFHIHFHDLPHSKRMQDECETRVAELHAEFPETDAGKCEVTLSKNGTGHDAAVHITGKDLDLASTAHAQDLHEAIQEAFVRARRQLRKHHDKVIFTRRRDAQKTRH